MQKLQDSLSIIRKFFLKIRLSDLFTKSLTIKFIDS